MTGTNSSNGRFILRRNVEINSNWYFSYDVFSGMKSSTTWNGNAIAQSPRKMFEWRDIQNTSDIRFLMVYRTIIDVILHLFIICNDWWCQLPFFSQTFRHNGIAVFGTMPPMCRSCPDVNKLRGMDTTILGQHRPFMSIKSFVQHSGWQKMVSLCSLIRLIGVCADRDQPEFLCSRSDSRNLEVHVATAGGWLTRYRPREVRNSIYRYRKIHIDYRSKFLYRFISIIYGNTKFDPNWAFPDCNSSLTDGYEMLHKAWNSEGEMPYRFPRSSIKFQGHTGQNFTDFDPNWAFPDYRPVAAFKSLRFALFIWTLYWIQPHLKTFTRPVMWVSWILSFHQYAWIFMATAGDVWIIPSFRIWDYVLHVEHISCVITNC